VSKSISDEYESRISKKVIPLIEQYRAGDRQQRPVIAIAGCAGVGKTSFSNHLLDYFEKNGVKAKVLRLDDFMDPNPTDEVIAEIHKCFEWKRLHRFLNKMLEGESVVEKPAWDFSGDKPFKVTENYSLEDVELLIFEGEFSFCDERTYDLLKYTDVRIILDAKDKDIILWYWERGLHLETTDFDEFTKSMTEFLSKYRKFLKDMYPYADFKFMKNSNHNFILNS